MASARKIFFKENGGIAECGFGFALGFFQAAGELIGVMDDAHATAATAHGGFDDDRIADFARDSLRFFGRADGFLRTGEYRNARINGQLTRGSFVSEQFEEFWSGSDEFQAGFSASASKSGILRKEAVTRMDGIDFVFFGSGDDSVNIEIGLNRTSSHAHLIGLIRFKAMECQAIFLRVDGDGAQAKLIGSAEDANGNFAAVGG